MVQNAYEAAQCGPSASDDRSAPSGGAAGAWRGASSFAPEIEPGLRLAWAATNIEGQAQGIRRLAARPVASSDAPTPGGHAIHGAFIARDLLEGTEDAIDEAKAAGERRSWDERAFDVAALVGEVISLTRPRADAVGVTLKLDPNGLDLPQVIGDPNRLRRVLLKLLGGAVRSRQTGEVLIALNGVERDHELALDITITAGPQDLRRRPDHLDPPAVRWRERWIDPEISFAVSQDLMAVLDALVTDTGTEGFDLAVAVRLRMAMARVEPAFTQTKSGGPVATDALKGLRILVAEDSDLNRELIQMLLAPYGCVIDEAINGQAALEAIDAQAYDAVLMDMNMPVMDGFEATRRIRARADARAHTPILAVTGRALSADIAKIRALGASGHLSKPFSTQELVGAILSCAKPLADRA